MKQDYEKPELIVYAELSDITTQSGGEPMIEP
jgi:hypothetical protein